MIILNSKGKLAAVYCFRLILYVIYLQLSTIGLIAVLHHAKALLLQMKCPSKINLFHFLFALCEQTIKLV